MASKIKIRITPNSIGSTVEIDGVVLEGVRTVRVSAGVDQPSTVALQFVAAEVDIAGQVDAVRKSAVHQPADGNGFEDCSSLNSSAREVRRKIPE